MTRPFLSAFVVAVTVFTSGARADEAREGDAARPRLGDEGLRLESVETALTAYEQRGRGFQSKAEAPTFTSAGSQRLTVFQPQLMVKLRQGERLTHRAWVPIDVITSASADAIDRGRPLDMMSSASRVNKAVTFDWTTTYTKPRAYALAGRAAGHLEENFRSIGAGLAASMSFADDTLTAAASANQTFDGFDAYDTLGYRQGTATRATTNGNLALTQILTPTTVVHVNYGLSAQRGELGSTWSSVPLAGGARATERFPTPRTRHAMVFRLAQYLPWRGALKGYYRFYVDDWGLVAHAAVVQLLQRVAPFAYVRGTYRAYTQSGVDFFTTRGSLSSSARTADSDLGPFDAQTVGARITLDTPSLFRGAHVDAGFERYWRTDGLAVNVALWQAGARF